ncbi:PRC-barrel domain-containing protein [Rhodocista pekingensis]|uniref:PRC-barrel domain-containing protein n=1 Tax=Rhodocista pekingensis TaxID=201185 RepID=A0ABW2KRR7_9PROT
MSRSPSAAALALAILLAVLPGAGMAQTAEGPRPDGTEGTARPPADGPGRPGSGRLEAEGRDRLPAVPEPSQAYRGVPGPAGGAVPGEGRVFAEELKDYAVHLADTEEFGTVAQVVLNLETGRLERILVATGGLLGVGETRYAIQWEKVVAVDTGGRELRVAMTRAELGPQEQAFDSGGDARQR